MRSAAVACFALATVVATGARTARADPWQIPVASEIRHVAGFHARGDTKVTDTALGYLTHLRVGDPIRPTDIPVIEEALMSSELFSTAKVTLEDGPDGVVVVATVEDKLSWFAAPTLYVLPTNRAVGVGYVENDFRGNDQKFLVYGQIGTQTSLAFAAFLDPAVHGSKLTYRLDLYYEHRQIDEYLNPTNDPTSFAIARSTNEQFFDGGALVGWNWYWWLGADLRLRGGYAEFADPRDAAGRPAVVPEKDGKDTTVQLHVTLDHRIHLLGVTWGPYAQLTLERSIPGLDDYDYDSYLLRAYYSWHFWGEHELEVRGILNGGYNLPFHEEVALGGATDLRGYDQDQFRGDFNAVLRAEYSVPLYKYKLFAFRGLAFYDGGYDTFLHKATDRDYLPSELGVGFLRNDVGIGFRVYVKNVVLPLLGLDLGYGIEGHSPEVYFELGLTDF
jgi:outer membrane protein assembly factor BamA|nr:BamA/TamA family outer membrane protein [Kofleriaceae bacterium]